jgi:hypothetical protein
MDVYSRRMRSLLWMIVILSGAAGCTSVPPLDTPTNPIRIHDVVDRVKCEIWQALKDDYLQGNYKPDDPFEFLEHWNALVSLTLTVDEQSSIAPGISFINPLVQIADKARGTFSQSFSFGLGGGVSGRASREELVRFSLPLNKKERDQWVTPCTASSSDSNIYGNLKLKEWIDSVLKPLKGTADRPPALKQIKHKETPEETLETLRRATPSLCPCEPRVDHGAPKNHDPYDLISHSVTFIVVWNANATPTWSLMRFKGPGAGGGAGPTPSGGGAGSSASSSSPGSSGSLFSASRIDNHILKITLGPNTTQGKQDQNNLQTNQEVGDKVNRMLSPF